MTGVRRFAVHAATMAIAICTLAVAAPAAADVTITPPAGVRGGAAKLVFRVSDDRPAAHTTQVDLYLPPDAQVAEVYPLSHPDWAPKVTMRRLDQPVETMHGGKLSDVVSIVSWMRAADAPAATGTPVELAITLGPLPDTARMVFTVVQTYSDATVVRWADPPATAGPQPAHPAPALALVAPPEHEKPPAEESAGLGVLRGAVLSAVVVALVMCLWYAVPRLLRSTRKVSDELARPTRRSARKSMRPARASAEHGPPGASAGTERRQPVSVPRGES